MSTQVHSFVKLVVIALGALGLAAMAACSTAPKSVEDRAELRRDAAITLSLAQRSDPSLTPLVRQSLGYAVFPTIGKGAIALGGAYGKGVLYDAGKAVGYCDLTQASIGLQLGGQSYSEIIFFKTAYALSDFKRGDFTFDAQTSAVAIHSGTGANARYSRGVAVFTMDETGLMYEASIGGQKFSYEPDSGRP